MTDVKLSVHTCEILQRIALYYVTSQETALEYLLTTTFVPPKGLIRSPVGAKVNISLNTMDKEQSAQLAVKYHIVASTSTQNLWSAIIEVLAHNMLEIEEDPHGIAAILAKANEGYTPKTRNRGRLR